MTTMPPQPDANPRRRYQYLTQTGPGTPAGELLRRYWQPLVLATEVENLVAPMPVRIMSEDLILFRDQRGQLGVLDRRCAHRCADLALARLEPDGIRCPYHGWLFATDGRCLDQPGEPPAAKDRVRARSYPLKEVAGAFWIYMGPGEPPEFPLYPALLGPNDYRYVTKWWGDCNWMQAHEGNIDPIHTSYLHTIPLETDDMKARWGVFAAGSQPALSVEETRFGVRLFTTRKLADGQLSVRVTNFVMPNACAVGGFEGGLGHGGATMLWDVPVDDHHHWRWEFIFHKSGGLDREGLERQYASEREAGTYRMWRRAERHFDQDREAMTAGSYAGLGPCFSVHDVVITNSQGPIHQHEYESLASSDIAIVRARRQLDEAAQSVARGETPRGVIPAGGDASFHDLIVITETVAADYDRKAFIDALARDTDLYRVPMAAE